MPHSHHDITVAVVKLALQGAPPEVYEELLDLEPQEPIDGHDPERSKGIQAMLAGLVKGKLGVKKPVPGGDKPKDESSLQKSLESNRLDPGKVIK